MNKCSWNNLDSISMVRLFIDSEARFVNALVSAAELRNSQRISALKQLYVNKPIQEKNEILSLIRAEISVRENKITYPNSRGRSLEIGTYFNYTLKTLINFYNNFSANKYQPAVNIDLSE